MKATSAKTTPTATQQQNQKKSKNKGFLRGYYAQGLASAPISLASMKIVDGMRKVSELSDTDTLALSKGITKGLEKSGLKAKGVEVFKMHEDEELSKGIKNISKTIVEMYKKLLKGDMSDSTESFETLTQAFKKLAETNEMDIPAIEAYKKELLSNKKFLKKMKSLENLGLEASDITDIVAKAGTTMFKMGQNACYLPNANKIIIPDKHLQTSVFHEMGHALNNNGGVILKTLQKARPLAKTIPAATLLIALLNKRPENSPKADTTTLKGKVQYVADKIKDNAALITGLSMAPMLLEEGIASLRGQGIAKQLVKDGTLSKELFKKIKLTNLGGFSSYALALVAGVIGCKFAIKIKDNIQEKYEAKKLAKEAKKAEKLEQKLLMKETEKAQAHQG